MIRPKTLNDLIGCELRQGVEGSICATCGMNHTITEEALKAEAIKWIKAFDSHDTSQNERHSINYWLNTPNWIQYFFNIKEEDLL